MTAVGFTLPKYINNHLSRRGQVEPLCVQSVTVTILNLGQELLETSYYHVLLVTLATSLDLGEVSVTNIHLIDLL